MSNFECCKNLTPHTGGGDPIGSVGTQMNFSCGHRAMIESNGTGHNDWVYYDEVNYYNCTVCNPPVTTEVPTTPYELSREAFDTYAAMDAPNLPSEDVSINLARIQVRLLRWHHRNFDSDRDVTHALGISEEVGELTEALLGLMAASGRISHAVLKNSQGIRGMDDAEKYRAAVADAVADAAIFATQLCTLLRLDFGTLYAETAKLVMQREWKK